MLCKFNVKTYNTCHLHSQELFGELVFSKMIYMCRKKLGYALYSFFNESLLFSFVAFTYGFFKQFSITLGNIIM